ncbi:histidine kinase [Mycolicibacterium sp. BiH015]|uniref:sensor histidine kinase n=1 Tax=Mycolicibacterium sp. BiH015 TaxID=3018808 RepID=UPI0022E44592|nr:histidine kinase [Mycolicibacterium sp. BiH015]MDA2893306.1 histidine kinase [Mycolicibacterium sp. BiH015]
MQGWLQRLASTALTRSTFTRLFIVVFATAAAVFGGAAIFSEGLGAWLPGAVAVLCGCLLLFPRCWGVAAVACTAAAGLWGWPFLQLLCVALFGVAVLGRIWVAIVMCGLALLGNLAVRPELPLWTAQPYGATLFATLAIIIGLWARNRRALVAALVGRVEQLRIERELREQSARLTERTVIAAEMHDVLAHRLSLIALHAGVLSATNHTLPVTVNERLQLLRSTAAEALDDLRDLLTALHAPESTGDFSHLAPTDREVADVMAEATAAGQKVRGHVPEMPADLPAAHRLAVLRVVQESLTNARKHAPGALVEVFVDFGTARTTISVGNDMEPATRPYESARMSGFGLDGLAERVRGLDGEIWTGTDESGKWVVTVSLPRQRQIIGKERA